MSDLISRQAAIDIVRFECGEWEGLAKTIIKRFEQLPSAQPTAEPVRHGKWLDDGQYDNFFPHHEWRCSECGEHVLEIGAPWFKYCPNCGARMDKE